MHYLLEKSKSDVITEESLPFYLNQLSKVVEVEELERDRRTAFEIVLDNPDQLHSYVIIRFNWNYRFIVSFTKVFYSGKTEHWVV